MKTNIKKVILDKKQEYYFTSSDNIDEIAGKLNSGVDIIIFNPIYDDSKNITIARQIRQLCSILDKLFVVQQRADLVEICDADGIYLKHDDMTIQNAKKILHDNIFFITSYDSNESDKIIKDK